VYLLVFESAWQASEQVPFKQTQTRREMTCL